MKAAIPVKDGEVFQHFGKASAFRIYDLDQADGKVEGSVDMEPEASGHGYLSDFLAQQGVSVVVCGGIGGPARQALEDAGILVISGVEGLADEAAKSLAAGSLEAGDSTACDHKDHDEAAGGGHCCH